MDSKFNIFRLNCLLNDIDSSNYNGAILSLIYEYIYSNNNKELLKKDCYNHITNDLKIKVELDIYDELVNHSKDIISSPIEDDILIKLTPEKHKEINDNIEKHSIESHIHKFILRNNLDTKHENIIYKLLTKAIYENINSFSISNIKSLITDDITNGFTQEDIDIFNQFIDDADREKQNALYNTFLKAIEFAILTSGKGVKEFSKNIFANKEYALDANIIFRLLGIGGIERKECTRLLLQSCTQQGVKFFYSIASYKELKRKIDSSKQDIKNAITKGSIETIENLIESDFNNRINEDFLTLYARLRKKKLINNVIQFEQYLLQEFKKIEKEFNISSKDCESKLKKEQLIYWQKKLYDKKKEKNEYTSYTNAAAKVDAINILYVQKIRGSNNYNYSDVKSFYLTTDRTLNIIMAELNVISETILPSQLFIIHNSLSNNSDQIDFALFALFLKRRTTEYKLTGKEILNYVDEIRQYTTEPETIEEVIKAYSDVKFSTEAQKKGTRINNEHIPTIKEYAQTYLDLRLTKAESGDREFKRMYYKALNLLNTYINQSLNITKSIDVLLTIIILPVIGLIAKQLTNNTLLITILIICITTIKFAISSKTNLLYKLFYIIYSQKVRKSSYYDSLDGSHWFTLAAKDKIKRVDTNIWKKRENVPTDDSHN